MGGIWHSPPMDLRIGVFGPCMRMELNKSSSLQIIRSAGIQLGVGMEVDGSIPYPLVWELRDDADPFWSPDGKSILFRGRWIWVRDPIHYALYSVGIFREGVRSIFIMDAFGITLTLISTDREVKGLPSEMQTSWSPDAGKIAFVSDRSENLDIWVLNFKDFAPTPIWY